MFSRRILQAMQEQLPGKRVRLTRVAVSVPAPPLVGAEGEVEWVDDLGTVHVAFDDGRHFGLIYEWGDRWLVLGAEAGRGAA